MKREIYTDSKRETHLNYLAGDFLAKWALEPEHASALDDLQLGVISPVQAG